MIKKTMTPVATVLLLNALKSGPQSLDDLTVVCGLAKPLVTKYVNGLLEATPRFAHVAGWLRDARGYPTIRQFAYGDLPDVECPKSQMTAAQRMAALRERRKNMTAAERTAEILKPAKNGITIMPAGSNLRSSSILAKSLRNRY
jgi:hypothetical protein